MITRLAARLRSAVTRRLLGVSAEEIRYTFGDVRRELRAASAEIAALRREVDRLAGHPDEEERTKVDRGRGARS